LVVFWNLPAVPTCTPVDLFPGIQEEPLRIYGWHFTDVWIRQCLTV